jgi:hypothetical protein
MEEFSIFGQRETHLITLGNREGVAREREKYI